jgi:hypothetical protein
MYFQNFPTTYYSYKGVDGTDVLVKLKDITRNVRVRKDVFSNITMYELYAIQEGETPELVSERFYGVPDYHWVIMLLNERYDYVSDWPLTNDDLVKYTMGKYGDLFIAHHYEDSRGFVVNASQDGAIGITTLDYETRINEQKRQIKMISNSMLSVIMENFDKIMTV